MRPQKVLSEEVLAGLTKVFRAKGFEGANLKELAEATGLKRASLYHRFPNGKQEMAEAVLNHIGEWVERNVFQALIEEGVSPTLRLKNGIAQIRKLYNGGEASCIFRALSMKGGLELFEEQISGGMKQWIAAFHDIGRQLGLSVTAAQEHAVQTLIEIQGSLVVTKGLHDVSIFETALTNIDHRYLS